MKKASIFLISPMDDIYLEVKTVVTRAIKNLNENAKRKFDYELITVDDIPIGNVATEIIKSVQSSDVVISNISSINSNVMYETGISHALNKPTVLLINNKVQFPSDWSGFRYFTYDPDNLRSNSLIFKLAETIDEAIKHPQSWVLSSKNKKDNDQRTVFVSYSHRDNDFLDRLKVHLKPLERKGSIQLWSDTLIQSGEKWKQEIERALERAAIAILLISADFLASDFIVNNELQPLLKAAEDKGTIIIPVILKPCRFLREPSLSQFQAINDPLIPLRKMNETEREEIYDKLSQRIELALEAEN